mmetsp:Transcript_14437/g.36809  ORF Transcript_14437/g.36809 Transcript_14437/m.36809 type:complete len:212 (-) Transcript_14437:245-880(-)
MIIVWKILIQKASFWQSRFKSLRSTACNSAVACVNSRYCCSHDNLSRGAMVVINCDSAGVSANVSGGDTLDTKAMTRSSKSSATSCGGRLLPSNTFLKLRMLLSSSSKKRYGMCSLEKAPLSSFSSPTPYIRPTLSIWEPNAWASSAETASERVLPRIKLSSLLDMDSSTQQINSSPMKQFLTVRKRCFLSPMRNPMPACLIFRRILSIVR